MRTKNFNVEALKNLDRAAKGIYTLPIPKGKQQELDKLTREAIKRMKS